MRPVYAPETAKDDVASFVSFDSRTDGRVHFFPMGGGFERSMPEDEFDAGFVEIDEAGLRELLGVWRRAAVTTDGDDRTMTGWVNGSKWNGFEQPLFTKEDVDAAISGGPLSMKREPWTGGVFWSERAGAYVVVESHGTLPGVLGSGRPLTEQDLAPLVEEAMAGGEVYERALGDHSVAVSLAATAEIEIAGTKVETFAIGDGWTWMPADEPDASPEDDAEEAVGPGF